MDDAIRKAEALIEALRLHPHLPRSPDRHQARRQRHGRSGRPDGHAARRRLHGDGRACARSSSTAAASRSTGPWPPPACRRARSSGRRYTDRATLDIVVRVLIDEINAGIVAQIRQLGGRAVGLHSLTLQCLFGQRLTLAWRGRPARRPRARRQVDARRWRTDRVVLRRRRGARSFRRWPSKSPRRRLAQRQRRHGRGRRRRPLQGGETGLPHRHARHPDATATIPSSLLASLDATGCRDLIARGIIDSGMIPKVEACLDSLRGGVRKTHMIDGRLRHSLLLEIYTASRRRHGNRSLSDQCQWSAKRPWRRLRIAATDH